MSARQCALCSLSLSLSLSIHCADIKLQNIYRPDLALGLVIGSTEEKTSVENIALLPLFVMEWEEIQMILTAITQNSVLQTVGKIYYTEAAAEGGWHLQQSF